MNINIQLDKRTIILAVAAAAAVAVCLLFITPLWSDVQSVTQEAKALDVGLSQVRTALQHNQDLDHVGHLISRGQVSLAINEMMEVGAALGIDFVSTSPQQIRDVEGFQYPILPIQMELKAEYENFGKFLGALEKLSKSIATVQQFTIERDEILLPDVRAQLTVVIHLKEGEGG